MSLGDEVDKIVLGRDAPGIGNTLVEKYFRENSLEDTKKGMKGEVSAIDLVVQDWKNVVKFLKMVSPNAEGFLEDGTDYLSASNDTATLIAGHLQDFGDLRMSKLNEGEYLDGFFERVSIGYKEGQLSYEAFLTVLTGIRPEDFEAVPGLMERYAILDPEMSDSVADRFYFGERSDGYFDSVFAYHSLQGELKSPSSEDPREAVINDWGRAVQRMRESEVHSSAMLPDGTLPKLMPDALDYLQRNRNKFPGFNMEDIDDGEKVKEYLSERANIGIGLGQTPTEAFLVLLTGATPSDLAGTKGPIERYKPVLLGRK